MIVVKLNTKENLFMNNRNVSRYGYGHFLNMSGSQRVTSCLDGMTSATASPVRTQTAPPTSEYSCPQPHGHKTESAARGTISQEE